MALMFDAVSGSKAGRIVYRNGSPMKLGFVKVVDNQLKAAEVYWFTEKRSTMVSVYTLRDYESLVLETEKKAANHRRAYDAALAAAKEIT